MSTQPRKCQGKGGVEACLDPKCPEKQGSVLGNMTLPSTFTALGKLKKPEAPKGWANPDTELFRTIHGSKLYGLSHPDSDNDFYVVTPTKAASRQVQAAHKIEGHLDTVTVDFKTFTNMAENGIPQALEAIFSKESESPYFEAYRQGWFANDPRTVERYIRTIKSFSLVEEEVKQNSPMKWLKYRQHALRLSMNLDELLHTGRFNPRLNTSQVAAVRSVAKLPQQQYLTELNTINPLDLNWTYPDYEHKK